MVSNDCSLLWNDSTTPTLQRERERGREGGREGGRERVCVCVREREKERERVCE